MPRRSDLHTILVIGSGPIVIGQACEFDYSGTQACKALREEGYRVVLVNSNPATIMTDPEIADRTYIEPMTVETRREDHRAREARRAPADARRPDRRSTSRSSSPRRASSRSTACELIGANAGGDPQGRGPRARSSDGDAQDRARRCPSRASRAPSRTRGGSSRRIGFPVIIRPSFTLGGTGGGDRLQRARSSTRWSQLGARSRSPITRCLIEESVLGWKEYELEVMRDRRDNVVIICSIENFDPMGVHTGDSITVAPAQTLTDKEYQVMRDAAIAIIREIGVDTGGSQHPVRASIPRPARMVVIEMNPRVSRSLGAGLEGHRLPDREDRRQARRRLHARRDPERHHRARRRPASSRRIDYVVTKIPRFAFEKFPERRRHADHADEVGRRGDGDRPHLQGVASRRRCARSRSARAGLERPALPEGQARPATAALAAGSTCRARAGLWAIAEALPARRLGRGDPPALDGSTPGSSRNLQELVDDGGARCAPRGPTSASAWLRAREAARLLRPAARGRSRQVAEAEVRAQRRAAGRAARSTSASTPAPPSSRRTRRTSTRPTRTRTRPQPTGRRKIMILGGGPNRIGQGIEFDYCCVHAAFALREAGLSRRSWSTATPRPSRPTTTPATGSTSSRSPSRTCSRSSSRRSRDGVIVQFGGQTPLKLAVAARAARRADHRHLARRHRPRRGPRALRRRCSRSSALQQPAERHGAQPRGGARGRRAASAIPVLVRPSYVLGGRAMEIVHDEAALRRLHARRGAGVAGAPGAGRPVPRRRDRGRRRRDQRRHARRDRRRDGAHRGGRRPLRRQRLLAAALLAAPRRDRGDRASPPAALALELGVRRPDERAVRGEGRATSTCSR